MTGKLSELWRSQLEQKLKLWQAVRPAQVPREGWIRAIRTSLALTRSALAQRLGISPSSLADLEQSEAAGTITLNSLRKVAAAMECDVVYALVPRTSLNGILEQRAGQEARSILGRVRQTMKLEAQEVEPSDAQTSELVKKLLANPKALWK